MPADSNVYTSLNVFNEIDARKLAEKLSEVEVRMKTFINELNKQRQYQYSLSFYRIFDGDERFKEIKLIMFSEGLYGQVCAFFGKEPNYKTCLSTTLSNIDFLKKLKAIIQSEDKILSLSENEYYRLNFSFELEGNRVNLSENDLKRFKKSIWND
ncbi:MAG: hypothetical protein C0177_06130 [Fervidicoccus fontis]|jgi:hypothetical protein|nr:MAG: hypothetical protein C0177_06130 [Fervidicoccus fontis]